MFSVDHMWVCWFVAHVPCLCVFSKTSRRSAAGNICTYSIYVGCSALFVDISLSLRLACVSVYVCVFSPCGWQRQCMVYYIKLRRAPWTLCGGEMQIKTLRHDLRATTPLRCIDSQPNVRWPIVDNYGNILIMSPGIARRDYFWYGVFWIWFICLWNIQFKTSLIEWNDQT